MTKVLIIQPDCRDYRIPLFKNLSNNFEITLLHFGEEKFLNDRSVSEIDLKLISIGSFYFVKSLQEECKKHDIIITVFDPHWLNCFILPFLTKKPVIFWGHGIGRSKFVSILRGVVGKKSDALITYDEIGKNNLVNIGIDSQKIFIAPNTIYVANSKNYANEDKNSILYVGRLQRRKELHTLIKSFAHVHHSLPKNTILKILGDGEQVLADLISMSKKLGIYEKVNFVRGTTDESELSKHFSQAYCYACPGDVGLGVLHSFSYGVPVITFKNRNHGPEFSNIRHNENGVLVDDIKHEFGKLLIELINSGAFQKLGNNAYHYYFNNRTIEHMVESFNDAIEYSQRE